MYDIAFLKVKELKLVMLEPGPQTAFMHRRTHYKLVLCIKDVELPSKLFTAWNLSSQYEHPWEMFYLI